MSLILDAGLLASVTLRGTSDADCCVYVRDLCVTHYGLPTVPKDLQALWCIHIDEDGTIPEERVWGPVHAANLSGVARNPIMNLEHHTVGAWYIAQMWKGANLKSGHTALFFCIARGVFIQVDSSRSGGPRVKGYVKLTSLTNTYKHGICWARLERR